MNEASVETLRAALSAIVGADHVRTAEPALAVDGVQPKLLVEPGDGAEAGRVLRAAKGLGSCVIPRGGGTKMSWGNVPRSADVVLSTVRLNRVVEHAWGDMTATVEAGCTMADLQETLAGHKQRLAVDALWPQRATVGGVLATNDSGALRIRFGSLRDFVTGATVALADGTRARSGGRVVKNVAGYDLPKLMIGALGTLGVILEATFRLYPTPVETETICFAAQSNEAAHEFMQAVLDSSLVTTGLQLIAEGNAPPEIAVRFEGHHAGIAAQALKLMEKSRSASVWRIAASNEVWHRRERLWHEAEQALVIKVSVLPTQLAHLCSLVDRFTSAHQIGWKLVAQAFGICALRLEIASAAQEVMAVGVLRAEIEAVGGTLVVLRCSLEVKNGIDVWGTAGDSWPLMQRVKEQFDSSAILNPNRFVGGI